MVGLLRGRAGASVAAFLADAGVGEAVSQFAGLEPGCHAGLLVGVAAEGVLVMAAGWCHAVGQSVLTGTVQLDVVAVVRAVAGDHGVEIALDRLVAAHPL